MIILRGEVGKKKRVQNFSGKRWNLSMRKERAGARRSTWPENNTLWSGKGMLWVESREEKWTF